jgi:topoisomerase-4 subunit A
MPTQPALNFEGIERLPLKTFTEKAYLDYSMYVILDRALPHIGDGQAQEVRAHSRRRHR